MSDLNEFKQKLEELNQLIIKYGDFVTDTPSMKPMKELKEEKQKQQRAERKIRESLKCEKGQLVKSGPVVENRDKFEPAKYIFVSGDGDSIGSTVEQRVMNDDLEGIIRQSKIIEKGQEHIKISFESLGGAMLVHGGDDNLALLESKYLDQLEDIRKRYEEITGFTMTFGVGNRMREAVKALVYGKLTGKNKTVYWIPEIKERLEEIARDLTPREKYEEHGLLPEAQMDEITKDFPVSSVDRKIHVKEGDAPIKSQQKKPKLTTEHLTNIAHRQGIKWKPQTSGKPASLGKTKKEELIEEHERLVDILESQSHKDDKEEAKRQKKELKGLKEEGIYTPIN